MHFKHWNWLSSVGVSFLSLSMASSLSLYMWYLDLQYILTINTLLQTFYPSKPLMRAILPFDASIQITPETIVMRAAVDTSRSVSSNLRRIRLALSDCLGFPGHPAEGNGDFDSTS